MGKQSCRFLEILQYGINDFPCPPFVQKKGVTVPVVMHQQHEDADRPHECHNFGQSSEIIFTLHKQFVLVGTMNVPVC